MAKAAGVFGVFPALAGLEAEARALLLEQLRPMRLPAGGVLFRVGELCAAYPFLVSGRVVVRRIARSGRAIVLYRVGPGQSCIMSTACLMSGEQASAEAVAEEDCTALALAPGAFARLLECSAGFRRFAFGACALRIGELMARIEEMADLPIDRRLAARLLAGPGLDGGGTDGGKAGRAVRATHAALAADIGTAREVVTRAMGRFAAAGWVRPGRGATVLLDPAALRALADGDDVTDAAAGRA